MHQPPRTCVPLRRCLLLLSLGAGCGAPISPGAPDNRVAVAQSAVDIFDSRVFNWQFYLNSYADLLQAGLYTQAAAQRHWQDHGIREGRQASPTFHTRQYLDLYPDLRAAFGQDFQAALTHYLTFGVSEARVGYQVGGGYGRYTISNGTVSVSTAGRTAGAVDSVMWNGRELVNSWDHGRQVQAALSINGWGECYNPTEAGSGHDDTGAGTTSVLQGIWSTQTELATQVLPAFWVPPGGTAPGCGPAKNPTPVSAYTMNTDVQVGAAGVPGAVQFLLSVFVPETVDSLTLEGPTGYLTGDLTAYYAADLDSGTLTPLPDDPPGEQQQPLILASADGAYAMGAWSPDLPQAGNPGGYGKFYFPSGNPVWSTNKWNIVFRYGQLAPGTLAVRSFFVVGTLSDVVSGMKQLYDQHRAGLL